MHPALALRRARRARIVVAATALLASLGMHAAAQESFWNGDAHVELTVDPTTIGIRLEPGTTWNDAREIVARVAGLREVEHVAPGDAPVRFLRLATADLEVEAALDVADALAAHPRVRAASPALRAAGDHYFVGDELLVRWRPGADRSVAASYGLVQRGTIGYLDGPAVVYAMAQPRCRALLAAARALHESGQVEFALPNFGVSRASYGDPFFYDEWHLHSIGQWGAKVDADVDALEAWEITRGDPSVVIAVIDTGVELTHPDLVGNLVPGTDVLGHDPDPSAEDHIWGVYQEMHGTAVAGIAAAHGDNGVGITGIAQHCKVMPIRFLSVVQSEQPTLADEANAILYAAQNGASIINCSWGPSSGKGILPVSTKLAIDEATTWGRGGLGCLVVFAAGNQGANADENGYAAYPRVIAVGASTDQDVHASYSNSGACIDLCAPSSGGVTPGTVTTDRLGEAGYSLADYTNAFGGTSSAAPLVAGVAALALSVNPYLTWQELALLLVETADKIDPAAGKWKNGHSPLYGFGKVNAHAAVQLAALPLAAGLDLYGFGLAGTFGVPRISGNMVPKIGNQQFRVTLEKARPHAPVLFLVGLAKTAQPFLGGQILVAQVPGLSVGTGSFTNALGECGASLPIPGASYAVGLKIYAQWLVQDPGGKLGAAATPGLQITLQP